jgi:hypothetical protein
VIIYKFKQGNLGGKKIVISRFQPPVKEKKSQIATLATDSAIPDLRASAHKGHIFRFP